MLTQDFSGYLPEQENNLPYLKETPEEREARLEKLRKAHHGQECIICFERKCVCKPRS